MIEWVIKRDGSKERFDSIRITNVILKAMTNIESIDRGLAVKLTREVINEVRGFKEMGVEDIQEAVLRVLKTHPKLFNAYQVRRDQRATARQVRSLLKVSDDLKLSVNAIQLLKKRYLKEGESTSDLFRRVASAVASVESRYNGDPIASEEEFFQIMSRLEFLPNSPTLMNAGLAKGQLSACFVLPINDSLNSIFTTLKNTALIHHSGGGVGINFSTLRPYGDKVGVKGLAAGPLQFIGLFDKTTDVVKQGGLRKGANMAVLNYDHPDIIEFIKAKLKGGFKNFNFSVSVTDGFMRKVLSNGSYWLINPRSGEKVKEVRAREVFDVIVECAWTIGDPGLLFIDEINRQHSLNKLVRATNPCAEQPLLDNESCNLGSINLSKMVVDDGVNWARLERVTRLGVRFLDNVIDLNVFPLKQVEEKTLASRKIGLGLMGFADMLIQLSIPYDSQEALKLADQLMSFINAKARDESKKLGDKRGSFPLINESKLKPPMRNAAVTTIAPTGSLSIIADCSPSIEPLFALAYSRKVIGTKLFETNRFFELEALKSGFYSEKLMNDLTKQGSVQALKVPKEVKELYKTALDIKPEWHVKMQAAFQKHVDASISKTVNLPASASKKQVYDLLLLAYKYKCKGVTVYRYGSHAEQVFDCHSGSCDCS